MNRSSNIIWLMLLSSIASALFAGTVVAGDDEQEVMRLSYIDREPGIDEYEVILYVSDRYIRLDEPGDDSGYIIYDDVQKTIYSVSHVDRSVLLIKEYPFTVEQQPRKNEVEYLQLAHAPRVAGKDIYNYRTYIEKDGVETTCSELQIAEGLLPEVTAMLQNYQNVISGQQVKTTDNRINEFQDACFFVDQVYNTGAYYDKGLPIQEWHSNERSRILTSYKKVKISPDQFSVPEDYRQFSVDKDTKTLLQSQP